MASFHVPGSGSYRPTTFSRTCFQLKTLIDFASVRKTMWSSLAGRCWRKLLSLDRLRKRCYNPKRKASRKFQVSHYPVQLHRRWNMFVINIAIAALTCSLATRTFRLKPSHGPTVQSAATQAMRQHLDRDGVRWIPPLPVAVVLDAPTFYPRISPAGPPLQDLPLHSPLYDH